MKTDDPPAVPASPNHVLPKFFGRVFWFATLVGTLAGNTANPLKGKPGVAALGWIIGPLGASSGHAVGAYLGYRIGGNAGALVAGATGAFCGGFLGVMFGGYAWEAIGEGILGTLLGAAVSLGVGAVCGVITGIVGGVFFGVLRALASAVRSMFQWPDPGRPIALMSQVLHTAVTSASHL